MVCLSVFKAQSDCVRCACRHVEPQGPGDPRSSFQKLLDGIKTRNDQGYKSLQLVVHFCGLSSTYFSLFFK